MLRYRGNWDSYVEQKAAREEQQLSAYKNQQKEIASLQQFADRFRAKASKASQAQSKLKQIDRMEKIAAPTAREKTIKFRFPQPPRSGLRAITLKDVRHAYDQLVVYDLLNFSAERGQRTVLVGPNGAGKSTLLKLLAGVLPVQSGERELGHNVRVGYFLSIASRCSTLGTPSSRACSMFPSRSPEQTARTVLGSFLFRGDDVFKTVGVLSGGEKSRLALVKLLLYPPNLLSHGRADHPSRCRLDRCAHRRAQAVRRDAHFHQSRRAFHPRDCEQRPAHQRRPAHTLRRRLSVLSR